MTCCSSSGSTRLVHTFELCPSFCLDFHCIELPPAVIVAMVPHAHSVAPRSSNEDIEAHAFRWELYRKAMPRLLSMVRLTPTINPA